MRPYPTEVTEDNWEELQAQGFKHLTNTSWSSLRQEVTLIGSSYELTTRINQKYGNENVKVGYMFYKDTPSLVQTREYQMVGIYVKST